MFKIWAKLLDEDRRLIANVNVSFDEKFDSKHLERYLIPICQKLDIANPVCLKQHKAQYDKFYFVKFLPADFVEPVSFSCLTLENGGS